MQYSWEPKPWHESGGTALLDPDTPDTIEAIVLPKTQQDTDVDDGTHTQTPQRIVVVCPCQQINMYLADILPSKIIRKSKVDIVDKATVQEPPYIDIKTIESEAQAKPTWIIDFKKILVPSGVNSDQGVCLGRFEPFNGYESVARDLKVPYIIPTDHFNANLEKLAHQHARLPDGTYNPAKIPVRPFIEKLEAELNALYKNSNEPTILLRRLKF